MTVAEIKEYIQNSKVKIDNMIPPNAKKKADEVLREVLSMLDELEPMTNKDYMDYKGYNGVTPKDYDENAPINLQDIEVIDLLKEIKALKENNK